MSGQIRAKVTAKVDYDRVRPPSPLKAYSTTTTRPPSPLKAFSSSAVAPPRLRSKVSSSATTTARKAVSPPSTASLSSGPRAHGPTPRAPSPFKLSHTPSAPGASVVKARVTGTAHGNATNSNATPSLPELRQRAVTTVPADSSTRHVEHSRRGSISSHVSVSCLPAPIPRHTALSPPQSAHSSEDGRSVVGGTGVVRVKSKVSHIVEHPSSSTQSLPPSPSFARHTRPARVPSVSHLSLSPPLAAVKTNGTLSPTLSAPGHQRSATTREIASPKINTFKSHQPRDDLAVNYTSHSPFRVDPAQIPLPSQSPPSSTVSFSSRSSASRSSVSYDTHTSDSSTRSSVPTLSPRPNGNINFNGNKHMRSRSSIDGLGIQLSPLSREPSLQASPVDHGAHASAEEDGEYGDSTDRKMRDEAKSIRKIADLEITNRSLLAINSTLEATKHRQAKEIRDLRRRLRESILILPPRAYDAAKSSITEDGILKDDEEEEEAEEDEEEPVLDGKTDESYHRVKSLIESLLESGRQALEAKPADFLGSGSHGTKVLSEEEARTWRGDDPDTRSILEDDAASFISQAAGDDDPSRPLTPSRIVISDSHSSEEEIRASSSLSSNDSAESASALPPITVTPSLSP